MADVRALALDGRNIVLPGLATAHSHAFQRALRGRTQRSSGIQGSFWSWRDLMYTLANKVTPDDVYDLSFFAFVELAMSGVTAVGEFHYLHHAEGGAPYEDRVAMADAVIRAARDAGVAITLLRVAYARGGAGIPLEDAQRRFADADPSVAISDADLLVSRFAGDAFVRVGLAPHSVRAVPAPWITSLGDAARARGWPLHMHVAEQRAEVDACRAEHGMSPVQLLASLGVLDERFVAVHATHLTDGDPETLGRAGAWVCVCRTTERDLGDGLADVASLVASGVRVCVGVDSHASSDAFDELRAVELDERSRAEARHVVADGDALLTIGSAHGRRAIGFAEDADDVVELDADDVSLAGATGDHLADAVVFGAATRAVRRVRACGEWIVEDGHHRREGEARTRFVKALARLGL